MNLPTMNPRIVLCYPVEERHFAQIQAAWPAAELVDAGQEGVARELFEADIYCGHAKVPVDWPGVVRQGRLRWIQSSAAGMDHCLVPSVIESDIIVTSASGVLSDQVAEHTVALLTGWFRSLPVFVRAQQAKEFVRRPTGDLTGKTVGIAGLGGVGRRVAEVLRPMAGRILATDLYPIDRPAAVDELWPADRLDDLLAESDVVVLCLPLSDATRGLFDAERIAQMRPGTLLANMARGQLVVTDAMVDALRKGHLSGAVMDVTDPEPLPVDSPLWEMPRVLITPHVGGQAAWRIDRMTRLFCLNLQRWQQGRPLINRLEEKSLGFPVRGGKYPVWGDGCENE